VINCYRCSMWAPGEAQEISNRYLNSCHILQGFGDQILLRSLWTTSWARAVGAGDWHRLSESSTGGSPSVSDHSKGPPHQIQRLERRSFRLTCHCIMAVQWGTVLLTNHDCNFDVLLTVLNLSIFISVFNQLDAQNWFHNKCSKHVEAWNKTYCETNFVHQVG